MGELPRRDGFPSRTFTVEKYIVMLRSSVQISTRDFFCPCMGGETPPSSVVDDLTYHKGDGLNNI
jgi:hypothetical protein